MPKGRSRRRFIVDLGMAGLVGALSLPGWGAGQTRGSRPFTIIIDPGHTPSKGGALGVRGVYEVHYNDVLAQQVCEALRAAGFNPFLSRTPAEEISLDDRARLAGVEHADLFLSIHHDSAQPKYLEKIEAVGGPAFRTLHPMAGYSLFVSRLNPQFDRSFAFARFLGEEMQKIGRTPATHHAEPIQGENRAWLDQQLGIYQFDDLVVLKKNLVPAVLLEVGLIVDPADEAYVSDAANQKRIVAGIVSAVQRYQDAFQ